MRHQDFGHELTHVQSPVEPSRGRPSGARSFGHASRQALLAELGHTALVSSDLAGLLDRACELLREVLDVEYTKVLQHRTSERSLVMVAGRGWNSSVVIGETSVPDSNDSQAGYTLETSRPVVVSDLAVETRFNGPELLTAHRVVSGISVAIADRDQPYGVLGVHTTEARVFGADDVALVRLVANIVGGAVQNDRAHCEVKRQTIAHERRAAFQTAIAECARALLASQGEYRLIEALRALLVPVGATIGFIERNVDDPQLGLCTTTVAEVRNDGMEQLSPHDQYWSLVPWDRMPTSRSHLERGEAFALVTSELQGPEREQYESAPTVIKSELDIPIFVGGRWEGLIGFADMDEVRDWTETDLSLLTAAATMIAAFWEREGAKAELQEIVASKDEFIATVSHELRTPLTSVLGLAEELHAGIGRFERGELESLLTLIATQSADMAYLIDDLLVAGRAATGGVSLRPEPIDLEREVKAVALQLGLGGTISIDGVADAWADPYRVRQIVRNLLTNAERYGGEGLRVRLTTSEAFAEFSVEDNGPGIADAERERIFEPYQRGHQRTGQTQSIGLGLAVSRGLARHMGGDLFYHRRDGWTVFTLRLPRRHPE